MSVIGDIAKTLSEPKEIDVSDLGVEGVEKLQFKFLSSSEMGVLLSHPEYKSAKTKEQRDLILNQLLVHAMLSKCDETVTLSEVKSLPFDVLAKISNRMMEMMDVQGEFLKNLQD